MKEYIMKKIEHWKWMVKQSEEKVVKRSLVGDDKLKEEIELLEDEVLTLKKENAKLKMEVDNAKKSNPYSYNFSTAIYNQPISMPIEWGLYDRAGAEAAESNRIQEAAMQQPTYRRFGL